MKGLRLVTPGERFSVLCLGAHSDDIEIGAGATLLSLLGNGARLDVHWCVLSAVGEREGEARASAADFLSEAASVQVETMNFRDGFFPEQGEQIKCWFEALKQRVQPDLILTHRREDAHQDHRQVCRLTWNTFRDHLILEYEIPKYDGDMGRPSVFMPLSKSVCDKKVDLIVKTFRSQCDKRWFERETFMSLMRLRGMECNAPSGYAEAFYGRKLLL